MRKYFSFLIICIIFNFHNNAVERVFLPEYDVSDVIISQSTEYRTLSGPWAIFGNQLYEYNDFQKKGIFTPYYTNLPNLWNNIIIDGKKKSSQGYMTLKLDIIFNENDLNKNLSLQIPEVFSAYRLWLNDDLLASSGEVGINLESSQAEWKPQIVDFKIKNVRNTFILQISNFQYAIGGIWGDIKLGNSSLIHKKHDVNVAFDAFLFGSLFIMGFYHLGLYLLRKTDKKSLFFGLSSLILSWRILVSGEILVLKVLNMNWELLVKLNFLSIAFIVPAFIMYFKALFNSESNKYGILFFNILSFLFAMFVVFTNALFSSKILYYFHYVIILSILYFLFVTIRAIFNKKEGAFIVLIAFTVLAFTALNDILSVNTFGFKMQLTPFGLFIFIFAQSFMLSKMFSTAFHKVEVLSDELNHLNKNLEEKVKHRTKDLLKKNAELRQANAEIRTLNELLPICSHCKKIRNDEGYWMQVDHYIATHTNTQFSHGICPDCAKEHYPEIFCKHKNNGGEA